MRNAGGFRHIRLTCAAVMSSVEDTISFLSSSEDSDSLDFNPVRLELLHPYLVDVSFKLQGITSLETRTRGLCRSAELELYWAVCDNNISLAEKLLAQSHNPNSIFRWRVEFAEDTREYSQFPLHRAVQSGKVELVKLLLQYGSDPNSKDCSWRTPLQVLFMRGNYSKRLIEDSIERSSADPVIAEMLLKRAAELDDEMWHSLFESANRTVAARWSFLEILLSEESKSNPRTRLLGGCCACDNEPITLWNIVDSCGEADNNGRYGYGVLEHCLKAGLEPHFLQRCLERTIKHQPTLPAAVILLMKAGVDVDWELEDFQGKIVTPFCFILDKVTASVGKCLENVFVDEAHSGDLDSEFSALWLLVKAGSSFPAGIHRQLVDVEVSIRLLYDKTNLYSETKNWSFRRQSAVMGHLQRCLDIIREIQPPSSLIDLSRIAVRDVLSPWSEDKVKLLQLPEQSKQCIKYHDCQAIVDGVAKYDWTWHDVERGRVSPMSSHSDSEESSTGSNSLSSDEYYSA